MEGFKDYMNEVFDDISSQPPAGTFWGRKGVSDVASFKDDDGTWYAVQFDKMSLGQTYTINGKSLPYWTVTFYPSQTRLLEPEEDLWGDDDAKYKRTGKNRVIPLLKKIASIVKTFLKTEKPEALGWNGMDGDLSRLYEKLAKKVGLPGYADLGKVYGFGQVFVRKDLVKYLKSSGQPLGKPTWQDGGQRIAKIMRGDDKEITPRGERYR